ncbi:SMI1/KNR4 family protein [Humisphaera borealis]|uniref:SMI1/KNR4 family protein n=1 Tax=Humisphaera borealis TaxID=2807512 RepID=A0A7M2WYB5_9BACT|nr:SMI1/KNR4 family protein [Humisphaera borealis]QOV90212.1 SMI1/KNR4 family protein [Humisphaera borealis]
MSTIEDIVRRAKVNPLCHLLPPAGAPNIPKPFKLPTEVTRFYDLCGGIGLLDKVGDPYPRYQIVAPSEVVNVCMATIGDEYYLEPPLDGWFGIGKPDGSDAVVVDLNEDGYGRCYDVFHETFADPNAAKVIALTFTEFLENLLRLGRNHWLKEDFKGYGCYGAG